MKQRLGIIYFALITSTFIYAGIVWVLFGRRAPMGTIEEELHRPVIFVLMLLSLATFTATFALARLPWITRWAIIEMSTLYGLIAAFIAHDWRLFVIGWVLSLIGFALAFPSRQEA